MPVFEIPCTWMVEGIMTIDAEDIDDAFEIAEERELPDFPEYVDDSFEINRNYAYDLNDEVIREVAREGHEPAPGDRQRNFDPANPYRTERT